MTRKFLLVAAICVLPLPAAAGDACANVAGDVVLSARTPEVDLYDAPNGKRVNTVKRDAFPACLAITSRAPNMMIQVTVNGSLVWVPPHMVNARLTGKKPAKSPSKLKKNKRKDAPRPKFKPPKKFSKKGKRR